MAMLDIYAYCRMQNCHNPVKNSRYVTTWVEHFPSLFELHKFMFKLRLVDSETEFFPQITRCEQTKSIMQIS